MICVMQDLDILRNSAACVTAPADRSFLGMENLQQGASISDGGYAGVSSERRVFPVVDSEENMPDLDARVSGEGERSGFGYVEEKVKLDIDGGDEYMMSMVGENRDSFVESSEGMHGYCVGDMVWGKVKSHPWWPGHIFNDAFASSSVRRMKGEGLVLVAFFGDSSYGWFDPAELIPFEPYFPEKSRQTTSRNFVRAVEEAVDEASRRGALAVACRCRNLHNYRPSTVPGYYYVDVVGYEPGGLYSSLQIKEARDNFVPSELLSFILQLSLGPRRNNGNTIEWIQMIAKLLAYRRSVFEEFDETYAQAFGVEPVRPSYDSGGVLDQTGRFAPRVAPLSGQLVIAEALGSRRSSTRLASHKSAKVHKNKYVLKRRDVLPVAASSSLPDLPAASLPPSSPPVAFLPPPSLPPPSLPPSSLPAASQPPAFLPPASQPPRHAFLPSFSDSGEHHTSGGLFVTGEPPASGLEFNYVLQKGEKLPPLPSDIVANSSSDDKPKPEVFLPETVELKNEQEVAGSGAHAVPADDSQEHDDLDDAMKEKVLKRQPEDVIYTGEVKKRRKKKKDGLSANQHAVSMDADHHRIVSGRSIGVGQSTYPDLVLEEDDIDMELPPGLELSSLQLPQLLNDLSCIALDPFYAVEQDAPAIVLHVFLRFRSLVYQKSLILLGASEPAAPGQPSARRDGRRHREQSSTPYSSKQSSKLGDVTKAVRKRDLSDRQENLSMKKLRKISQLKELASKKKAAMRQNNSELQQQPKTKDQDSTVTTAAEATRKQELPPPPKQPSPTFLTMKFPPRSSLPSASNLKARFARFGPLEPAATRLYWKSYSCKVLFKYKSDAQSAYDFAKNNDLFGQVKVSYNLRDFDVSATEQPAADAQSRPSDSTRPDKDPIQYVHGSAVLQRPLSSQGLQSQLQLKSILKKPGGDESGPNGAAASSAVLRGAIVKESPRVKFMLKVDDNRSEPPPTKVVTSSSNGGGQVILLEPADQISRQTPKSIGFSSLPPPPPSSPPPPPQQQQQHLLLPSRGLETHPRRIPMSSSSASQQMLPLPPPPPLESLPPPPPPRVLPQPRGVEFHPIHGLQRPFAPPSVPREQSHVDISGPMLSLLLKCNDIVSKVKSSLGYTPYHSL